MDVSRDIGRWIEKWDYILRNDLELAKEAARLALIQLDELVYEELINA